MRTWAAAVAIVCCVLAACGQGAGDIDDLESADLVRRCGQIEFDGDASIPLDLPPADDFVLGLLNDAAESPEFGGVEGFRWTVAEQADDEILVLGQDEAETYRDVRFVKLDGSWRAAGWGGCYMHFFVPGHRLATWNFPLGERPRPGDTTATILIKEQCVGSTPLTADNSIALSAVTDDRITISVIGPRSPQADPDAFREPTCNLATSVPKTITLPVPADGRPIYDGGARGYSKRTI